MPAKSDDTKQVATRVSREAFDTLQVALIVEGVDTMQELLRPVVEDYARRLADEPEVKAINASVSAYRDRKRRTKRAPASRKAQHADQSQPQTSAESDAP
jgi:hypothetical protein